VTGPGLTLGRWSPTDETLLHEVPDEIEVRRVAGPEPPPSSGRRRRAESWLGATVPWRRWWVEGAAALAPGLDVDLIFASMSPYASAEAASRIAAALGKPWIAELRDPWALDEMMVFPTELHRRRELVRMGEALATASAIVMNTPEAAAQLRAQFPRLGGIPVFWIPNGYDGEDFSAQKERRSDDAFRIVHTGYFHTELGRKQHRMALKSSLLGGSVGGVDILTRSHLFLLRAVERVLAADPSAPIELHLAGQLSDMDIAVTRRFPFVRLHGYLPHAESVDLLHSANLLFLPMQDLPAPTRATIVPGKTYEYLAARRPILAAVPQGDARDLLASSGVAHITEPRDVEAMVRAIELQLRRWRTGNEGPPPNETLVASFERRRLTALLAAVYDAVLERERVSFRSPVAL
jgi:glycosyltransferase involved in cell wall biosynthesis